MLFGERRVGGKGTFSASLLTGCHPIWSANSIAVTSLKQRHQMGEANVGIDTQDQFVKSFLANTIYNTSENPCAVDSVPFQTHEARILVTENIRTIDSARGDNVSGTKNEPSTIYPVKLFASDCCNPTAPIQEFSFFAKAHSTPSLSSLTFAPGEVQEEPGVDEAFEPEEASMESDPSELPAAAELVEGSDLFAEYTVGDSLGLNHAEVNSESERHQFRNFQDDKWFERFQELCNYKRLHGHCVVPYNYNANPQLVRWVKRQRNQYKCFKEGVKCNMTEERAGALQSIGFVWDCQETTWEMRLAQLRDYRAIYHHCNVPTSYPQNPALAMWVKGIRRQYKFYRAGMKSSMTARKIAELEEIGFKWEVRPVSNKKAS